MVREAAHPDRIVVDLDRTDLELVVNSDIESAAERRRKAGVGESVICETGRTCRADRRRTRKFGKFRTGVSGTDESMREWLPRSAPAVVFDLDAAEEIVQRIAVLSIDDDRSGRIGKGLVESSAVEMSRKITLYAEPAAEVVNTARLKTVKVFAITEKSLIELPLSTPVSI
jgi:hypothetical protein